VLRGEPKEDLTRIILNHREVVGIGAKEVANEIGGLKGSQGENFIVKDVNQGVKGDRK